MSREAEKRELLNSLVECMQKADELGLPMVGIFLSHAIDFVFADGLVDKTPPKNFD